jgi:hypothetical protein
VGSRDSACPRLTHAGTCGHRWSEALRAAPVASLHLGSDEEVLMVAATGAPQGALHVDGTVHGVRIAFWPDDADERCVLPWV